MAEKRDQRAPDLRRDDRNLEAVRARQLADDPGHEAVGRIGQPAEGVLVQVCMECGKEYMYETQEPPADLVCEKCGSQVFRSFFTPTVEDDVSADFRETTERDVATDAPRPETTGTDLLDLNNI